MKGWSLVEGSTLLLDYLDEGLYSKMSFLVQIKFITEDSEQTQTQTLIIN